MVLPDPMVLPKSIDLLSGGIYDERNVLDELIMKKGIWHDKNKASEHLSSYQKAPEISTEHME
jgi:hypothetical protein